MCDRICMQINLQIPVPQCGKYVDSRADISEGEREGQVGRKTGGWVLTLGADQRLADSNPDTRYHSTAETR
jgi:hypothetical protein